MQAAVLHASGTPALVEQPDPGPPGPDEIVVDMLFAPINPADQMMIAGRYTAGMQPGAVLGAEGVGIVTQAGAHSGIAVGSLVLPRRVGCWTQRRRLPAADAIAVPPGVAAPQAATLRINPATAARMLALAPAQTGWVVQNAAGGAVGRLVAALATRSGLQCCSILRNPDGVRASPGEVLVADGADLPARVAACTGGAPIHLALDAVAGHATHDLASCLARAGVLVVFGHLSGLPCSVASGLLTGGCLTLRGFSLRMFEAGQSSEALAAYYRTLATAVAGAHGPVAATYRLHELDAALAHAARAGRGGKILLDLGNATV